ncbi:MAG: dTDP-4-dehydrorhamnose reductase [Thermodesulfovibrionia bacterium]
MRILITGGGGQLGSDCSLVLGGIHDVIVKDSKGLDITDMDAVDMAIQDYTPDIVLNCAAYTKVDMAETERKRAWDVNVEGPRNLSMSIKKHGAKLIHISTDYVFDGRRQPPEPYTEDDEPSPISYYGKTKLEGERAIMECIDDYAIIRTAWLYGMNGHNFLKTILRLAIKDHQREIRVVNDQYGSPTWTYSLARQISIIIDTDKRGIYHATSEGYTTWYELAVYFLNRIGIRHRIIPCTTEEYPTPARRPKNSILENKRLKEEGINIMPLWMDDIDRFVEEFGEDLIAGANTA